MMGSLDMGTIGSAYGAYKQAQAAQQEAMARQQAYNQQAAMGSMPDPYSMGYLSPWRSTGQDALRQLAAIAKPCPYCKRTKQTPEHQSCDGCGAPR